MRAASVDADWELVGRAAELARGKFAARADQYDREASFPAEDFADLFRAGLHGAAVPRSYGGHGLGPDAGLFTLWMITKELAKADMALARCWEGHVNSQMLLTALGDARQKDRWLHDIVERGEIWAAWSGEPQVTDPRPVGPLRHRRARGRGWLCRRWHEGLRNQHAGPPRWAILLVNLHGPGARVTRRRRTGSCCWPATWRTRASSSTRAGGILSGCAGR